MYNQRSGTAAGGPGRFPACAHSPSRPAGILTQMVSDEAMKPYGSTYIPASYVKYVEAGGSRVVPIRLTLAAAEYEAIFRQINGLLLIGGAVDLETSAYARVAKIFYALALTANDAGDFFPIWGTCMGMQLLTVLAAGKNLLSNATAENVALPLNLTTEAGSSRMFEGFPSDLMKALIQEPLTGNFHHYVSSPSCLQTLLRTAPSLSQPLKVTRYRFIKFIVLTNTPSNNTSLCFLPGKRYPFYGVQWHPEVNRFQWKQLLIACVTLVFCSGRRSLHQYDDPEEEVKSLIYKYAPVYAAKFTGYEQIYFF
uniref:folate gamma-glutamyl hydrolase n=1 Tax=Mola mola TaxID=94237 RepID=A0A3Q3WXH8_MOLML